MDAPSDTDEEFKSLRKVVKCLTEQNDLLSEGKSEINLSNKSYFDSLGNKPVSYDSQPNEEENSDISDEENNANDTDGVREISETVNFNTGAASNNAVSCERTRYSYTLSEEGDQENGSQFENYAQMKERENQRRAFSVNKIKEEYLTNMDAESTTDEFKDLNKWEVVENLTKQRVFLSEQKNKIILPSESYNSSSLKNTLASDDSQTLEKDNSGITHEEYITKTKDVDGVMEISEMATSSRGTESSKIVSCKHTQYFHTFGEEGSQESCPSSFKLNDLSKEKDEIKICNKNVCKDDTSDVFQISEMTFAGDATGRDRIAFASDASGEETKQLKDQEWSVQKCLKSEFKECAEKFELKRKHEAVHENLRTERYSEEASEQHSKKTTNNMLSSERVANISGMKTMFDANAPEKNIVSETEKSETDAYKTVSKKLTEMDRKRILEQLKGIAEEDLSFKFGEEDSKLKSLKDLVRKSKLKETSDLIPISEILVSSKGTVGEEVLSCTKGEVGEDMNRKKYQKCSPNFENNIEESRRELKSEVAEHKVPENSSDRYDGTDVDNTKSDTNVTQITGILEKSKDVRYFSQSGPNLSKNSDIKTLEDALKYFDLHSRLQGLERSLEDLRRHKKSKEEHESILKEFDKYLLKLSQKYHPDRVKNRGGSAEEMANSQNLQTALNATRKVLNILNKSFMEDIDIDHKYEFYTKVDISLLGNEDEIENHIYEVLFKINLISEIKRQNIIAVIKTFLKESHCCIKSYLQNDVINFEKYRSAALFYLKSCIKGYEKLLAEYQAIEEECEEEKLDNIHSLINKMRKDSSKQLKHLQQLLEVCKRYLNGKFEIFTTFEPLDDYFVFPFVCYMNVILMCNVMMRNTGTLESLESTIKNMLKYSLKTSYTFVLQDLIDNEKTRFLTNSYYLASYFNGDKKYKSIVLEILGKQKVSKDELKRHFDTILQDVIVDLENKFKIDEYNENITNRHVTEELRKCIKMKAEFEKEKKALSKGIEHLKKNNAEMKERWDRMMKDNQEFSNRVKESLEQTTVLKERLSAFLSDKSAN